MSKIIVALRLISAEDIIVQVDQSEFTKYKNGGTMRFTATAPALIGMVPGQNGQPSVGLADYLPFADKKEVTLTQTHVMFDYVLDKGIENAYRKRFGPAAGLVLPESQGIILPFTKREE